MVPPSERTLPTSSGKKVLVPAPLGRLRQERDKAFRQEENDDDQHEPLHHQGIFGLQRQRLRSQLKQHGAEDACEDALAPADRDPDDR